MSKEQAALLRYYAYTRPGWLGGALATAISAGLRSLGSGYSPPWQDLVHLRGSRAKLAPFPELETAVAALLQAVDGEARCRELGTVG